VTSSPGYLLCSSLLLCLACASEPTGQDSVGGGAGSSSTAGAGGSGSAPESCPAGPGRETTGDAIFIGNVSGRIVDEQGQPTSSGLVQICGKDQCINADVPETGELAQRVMSSMVAPACKFGNGKSWGKLAIPLATGDTDFGTLTTVTLPPFSAGAALEAGKSVSSGGVTLSLSDDARVEIDTLTYEDEREFGFRAARLPESTLEQLGQGFVLGFALAPVETHICPSPALSIENSTDLPAGTELELFIHGLDVLEAWAPYAGWQKVGEGSVSDDGQTLDFPEGVPLLTAIGVREKG
jgi:hypothetical protein